jgi:DNA-binding IclR family transcriptional regulator
MANIKAKAKPARVSKPKIDRGEASYVVQARKMKALIDTLKEQDGPAPEAAVLKELAKRGFDVHPRTLAREVDRVRELGYGVTREASENGIVYAIAANEAVAEAIASLDAVRKELKKAGMSALEKQVQSAVKVLKA